MRTTTTLSFQGLTLGVPQTMGAFRLVPLLRDRAPGDLRIASRDYGRAPAVVGVDSRPLEPGIKYVSYVPHGFVVSYANDGSQAAFGAKLGREAGSCRGVNLLHRMVKGEGSSAEGGQFRMLPLHLAMEGYLALHFGGPDTLWGEYSRHAQRFGLSPRVETSVAGAGLLGFEEALRVFEIAPTQVGSVVLVADALAAAFVVSHPDDYRRLHRSLLEDFYGELLYRYALLYPEPARAEAEPFDEKRVEGLDDLRAELARARRQWADFATSAIAGLEGRAAYADMVREAGPFHLERFTTRMHPDDECHVGERIVRSDGTLEYLKSYRLSAAQVRRGFLLETLGSVGWRFDEAAAKLGATRDELARRLHNAGLGYILAPGLLASALRTS
jgi:ARPP-2-like protein